MKYLLPFLLLLGCAEKEPEPKILNYEWVVEIEYQQGTIDTITTSKLARDVDPPQGISLGRLGCLKRGSFLLSENVACGVRKFTVLSTKIDTNETN